MERPSWSAGGSWHSASGVERAGSAAYLHLVVSAAYRVVALTKLPYFALTY